MIKECELAGVPKPNYFYDMSGFFVEFRKDIYNEEYLRKLGLNERQVKAVLYAKGKGKITNKEYQEVCNTSERTALRDLGELTRNGILIKTGSKKGTFYKLIG